MIYSFHILLKAGTLANIEQYASNYKANKVIEICFITIPLNEVMNGLNIYYQHKPKRHFGVFYDSFFACLPQSSQKTWKLKKDLNETISRSIIECDHQRISRYQMTIFVWKNWLHCPKIHNSRQITKYSFISRKRALISASEDVFCINILIDWRLNQNSVYFHRAECN